VITPYAKLRVSINGGAAQTGGVTAPASATAQFSFESTVGWTKYRLELIGPPGWALPAGWTDESGTYVYTGVDTPPPLLTLPDASGWGKFMPTLTVNDGLRFGAFSLDMIDTSTAISIPSANSLVDVGTFEDMQFATKRGWLAAIQTNLRRLNDFITSGGGGGGGGGGITVGGTAHIGDVPTVTALGPTAYTHAAPSGGSGGGLDYTIDFSTSNRDYRLGSGAGSGSAGDNAQTNPFTITANNGTTVPTTLSGGLIITPENSLVATVLASTSLGLRGNANSTGGGGSPLKAWMALAHLGIDRTREFSVWLLLERTIYSVSASSYSGVFLQSAAASGLGSSYTNLQCLVQAYESPTPGVLTSEIVGRWDGAYTSSTLRATNTSDNVFAAKFGPMWAELYSTPDVGGAFPSSGSLASMRRRGRADLTPLAMASATGRIFPNDDDRIHLHWRADVTSCDVTYKAMRVVQAP
jgi:hypothetical protein